jgi:hypothetical protein
MDNPDRRKFLQTIGAAAALPTGAHHLATESDDSHGSVTAAKLADNSVKPPKTFDPIDIRWYMDEAALFAQYAVEGIQAAIDANETDLLLFPKGVIPISDSLIIWRTLTLRGVRDENYWHEYNDRAGTRGMPHPQVGTTFWTEGGGVARRWTAMEDADDPINPMFVLLGSQIYMRDMSIRTGIRNPVVDSLATRHGLSGSSAGWHSARFIPGTRAHCAEYVSIQGENGVGFQHAVYVDATNSKYNTALNALPHYSKIDINLMDVGPTDIRDRNCIYAGVKAFRVQGRTGSFPEGQNPYAPNGMSDMKIHAHFYADGPLADRQDHGALIEIDYAMPHNWRDGSNGGQNATFAGRLDGGGKWSLKLKRCRGVRIYADYMETSHAYQAATPSTPRAVVLTDSAYTGDFAIISGKWFSNIKVDRDSIETTLVNFGASPALGRRLHYDGLESGASNTMRGRSGDWSNNVIPEDISTAADGERRDVEVTATSRDTYLRRRKRAAGKGEVSFDGSSWFSYEEGTWTPVLRGAAMAGSNTYTIQAGSWRRKGNEVTVRGTIQISGAVDSAMAGQFQISGLPYPCRDFEGSPSGIVVDEIANVALKENANLAGYIAPNSDVIALSERLGNDTSITVTSKLGRNFSLRFHATYEILGRPA